MPPSTPRRLPGIAALAGVVVGLAFALGALSGGGASHSRAAGPMHTLVLANLASDDSAGGTIATASPTATGTTTSTATATSTTPTSTVTTPGSCSTSSRWLVKTLADPAAPSVNRQPVVRTVHDLAALTPPAGLDASSLRQQPNEFVTFQAVGLLLRLSEKSDRDFELLLSDPATNDTIVADFPRPTCIPTSASPDDAVAMGTARNTLTAACGTPRLGSAIEISGAVAMLQGVGFFDPVSRKFELHPIVHFELTTLGTCRSGSPSPTPTGTVGPDVEVTVDEPNIAIGSAAAVFIHTVPPTAGLTCTGQFIPTSGSLNIRQLGSITTGADGTASWVIFVAPTDPPGNASIQVDCANGKQVQAHVHVG